MWNWIRPRGAATRNAGTIQNSTPVSLFLVSLERRQVLSGSPLGLVAPAGAVADTTAMVAADADVSVGADLVTSLGSNDSAADGGAGTDAASLSVGSAVGSNVETVDRFFEAFAAQAPVITGPVAGAVDALAAAVPEIDLSATLGVGGEAAAGLTVELGAGSLAPLAVDGSIGPSDGAGGIGGTGPDVGLGLAVSGTSANAAAGGSVSPAGTMVESVGSSQAVDPAMVDVSPVGTIPSGERDVNDGGTNPVSSLTLVDASRGAADIDSSVTVADTEDEELAAGGMRPVRPESESPESGEGEREAVGELPVPPQSRTEADAERELLARLFALLPEGAGSDIAQLERLVRGLLDELDHEDPAAASWLSRLGLTPWTIAATVSALAGGEVARRHLRGRSRPRPVGIPEGAPGPQ